MTSIEKHSAHNRRLVEYCLPLLYPDGNVTLKRILNDGLISGSRVAECAVSKVSGIKLDPVGYTADLIDGSDVKTATVYHHQKQRFLARITNIKNKTGVLRCMVYNPFNSKWHFLLIPYEVYKLLYEVTIFFDKKTMQITGKYSKYEVDNFKEICIKV